LPGWGGPGRLRWTDRTPSSDNGSRLGSTADRDFASAPGPANPLPRSQPAGIFDRLRGMRASRRGDPRQHVFTTGQIAQLTHTSARTVSNWIDRGELVGFRVPGTRCRPRRVTRAALVAFLKRHNLPAGNLEEGTFFQSLLVGTEDQLRQRLAKLLREADGFRRRSAAEVFSAGLLVERYRPDAVVADVALGRGEALLIARILAALPPPRPVCLVVAAEDETAPHELRAAGCDEVFTRPFDVKQLTDRLRCYRAAGCWRHRR